MKRALRGRSKRMDAECATQDPIPGCTPQQGLTSQRCQEHERCPWPSPSQRPPLSSTAQLRLPWAVSGPCRVLLHEVGGRGRGGHCVLSCPSSWVTVRLPLFSAQLGPGHTLGLSPLLLVVVAARGDTEGGSSLPDTPPPSPHWAAGPELATSLEGRPTQVNISELAPSTVICASACGCFQSCPSAQGS